MIPNFNRGGKVLTKNDDFWMKNLRSGEDTLELMFSFTQIRHTGKFVHLAVKTKRRQLERYHYAPKPPRCLNGQPQLIRVPLDVKCSLKTNFFSQ